MVCFHKTDFLTNRKIFDFSVISMYKYTRDGLTHRCRPGLQDLFHHRQEFPCRLPGLITGDRVGKHLSTNGSAHPLAQSRKESPISTCFMIIDIEIDHHFFDVLSNFVIFLEVTNDQIRHIYSDPFRSNLRKTLPSVHSRPPWLKGLREIRCRLIE